MINVKTSFVKRHPYLTTIFIALTVCVLLVWLSGIALKVFTRHGQSYPVPDFTDMSLNEAQLLAKQHHMDIVVTDSVYIHYRPRGVVLRQHPKSGTMVKKHRHIFLAINTLMPRMVEMPDVEGYSLRQAITVLSAKNLHVGKLSYVSDIATNNVLKQKYNGEGIAAGVEIPSESYIDLTLGLSSSNTRTVIPQVTGYTFTEAKAALAEASLNTGAVHYDNTVTTYVDSLFARVYKQTPAVSQSVIWTLGLKVELWLTKNDKKIK
ncbi:MAG: PASTA domain-containing protein [Prevotellaceae bacterium]|jgi:beta-lactam-binding protein with PASTA domain|nr:PASTA domain-containing protein [Prevotellaceae bacterium]